MALSIGNETQVHSQSLWRWVLLVLLLLMPGLVLAQVPKPKTKPTPPSQEQNQPQNQQAKAAAKKKGAAKIPGFSIPKKPKLESEAQPKRQKVEYVTIHIPFPPKKPDPKALQRSSQQKLASTKPKPKKQSAKLTPARSIASKPTKTRKKSARKSNRRSKRRSKKRQAPYAVAHNQDMGRCASVLAPYQVSYTPAGSKGNASSCNYRNAIRVTSIAGVSIAPSAVMTCDMAYRTGQWLSEVVHGQAQAHFGSSPTSLTQISAYSCRRRPSGKISEHGFANALDIASFRLGNGRRTTVTKDYYNEARFWRSITRGACSRFKVVLSPVSNKAHYNHLHLDAGRWSVCEF